MPLRLLHRAGGLGGAAFGTLTLGWLLLWLTGESVWAMAAAPVLGFGVARLSRVASERALRGVLRRRVEGVSLRELAGRADGGLVRVRGVVRLGVGGALTEDGCVFERVVVTRMGERPMVKERAVDFVLEDDGGEEMLVEVADAHLVHMFGTFNAEPVRIVAGDSIEVVARKQRVVDPSLERLPRQDPLRVSLSAPLPRPLLIVPQPVTPPTPRRLTG